MEERDNESPIKSVRKAMAIFDVLSDARRPLRVSEIAARLNISASAVSRLIATLSKGELVHQDEETGRCYLGLGLTVLGANALGRRGLDRIAIPIMDEVANRIRGHVGLSRLTRGKAVVMRALPSPLSQGVNLTVVAPFHSCSPGKVLTSAFSVAQIRDMIATYGLDPITTYSITDPARFIAALETIRADGFAIDNEESSYNHRHVACPIFDHNGNVVAALSAGGTISDFPWRDIPALIQVLSQSCLRISRELGYLGEARVNLTAFDEKRYLPTAV